MSSLFSLSDFLAFLVCVFPFFSKDFMGLQREKTLPFFVGFKEQGLEGQGNLQIFAIAIANSHRRPEIAGISGMATRNVAIQRCKFPLRFYSCEFGATFCRIPCDLVLGMEKSLRLRFWCTQAKLVADLQEQISELNEEFMLRDIGFSVAQQDSVVLLTLAICAGPCPPPPEPPPHKNQKKKGARRHKHRTSRRSIEKTRRAPTVSRCWCFQDAYGAWALQESPPLTRGAQVGACEGKLYCQICMLARIPATLGPLGSEFSARGGGHMSPGCVVPAQLMSPALAQC